MRPSSKPTGAVWHLLSEWSDNHPFKPNQTRMADLFDVSTSLISDWKYMQSVMQVDEMERIAEVTGIELAIIARAVAEDRRRVMGNAEHPAPTIMPSKDGQPEDAFRRLSAQGPNVKDTPLKRVAKKAAIGGRGRRQENQE